MVDATHPFAATISAERAAGGEPHQYAAGPAGATRLARAPARRLVDLGGRCRCRTSRCRGSPPAIPHDRTAVAAGFSSLGQTGRCWSGWSIHPAAPLPRRWIVILSRGPYSYAGERTDPDRSCHRCDSSPRTRAVPTPSPSWTPRAISAYPVVIIARPERRQVPLLETVAEATAWCLETSATLPRRADRARDPLTSSSLGD